MPMTEPESPQPTDDSPRTELREQILDDFEALRIPLRPSNSTPSWPAPRAKGLSHLEFLRALIGEQADQRRERSIAHRIREARFREEQDAGRLRLAVQCQRPSTALQIEELATGEFIRRRENLVLVGQSGVGKSHFIQAIGQQACVLGYRVRYTTSAGCWTT